MNQFSTLIANQSIFGEYRLDEDRVTAALLQVLRYGGMELIGHLFGNIFDVPSNEITISTQVKKGHSRLDGELIFNCNLHIMVESKIVKNALNRTHDRNQLAEHLKAASAENAILLYITPDDTCPQELAAVNVAWISWKDLVFRLKLFKTSDALLIFLINQFELLIDNLVFNGQKDRKEFRCFKDEEYEAELNEAEERERKGRVIIVGGRWGEDVALQYNFYACQPNRYFRPASYIAFCYDHRIKYLFKITDDSEEAVDLRTRKDISKNYFKQKEPSYTGSLRKYFHLKLVKEFDPVIQNVSKDKNGNPCAFVQRQTYTTYDKIMKAKTTNEL